MITPTQSNITAAMKAFLGIALPGVEVDVAQANRVPEPQSADFVIMTPLRFERIETNYDTFQDCRFVGSISGGTLSVSSVSIGALQIGATISGALPGTVIQRQSTGSPGGVGTYVVSNSQTIGPGTTLAAGAKTIQQNSKVTLQLDFHSANDSDAGDMAMTVATLLRDEFGVDAFAGLDPPLNSVVPLYADDPRQMPFINDQQQYEWRWVLEAVLQANDVVTVPQQFSDSLTLNVVEVQATYH